jgi:hypothetical protein
VTLGGTLTKGTLALFQKSPLDGRCGSKWKPEKSSLTPIGWWIILRASRQGSSFEQDFLNQLKPKNQERKSSAKKRREALSRRV